MRPRQLTKHSSDFVLREHDRQMFGPLSTNDLSQIAQRLLQNFFEHKHECVEGLILSAGGNVVMSVRKGASVRGE